MAWTPNPALRGNDYARPAQYGKPTGPRNAAAFVRTDLPGTPPQLAERIPPLELDEA